MAFPLEPTIATLRTLPDDKQAIIASIVEAFAAQAEAVKVRTPVPVAPVAKAPELPVTPATRVRPDKSKRLSYEEMKELLRARVDPKTGELVARPAHDQKLGDKERDFLAGLGYQME